MPERELPRPSNRVLVLFGATGDLAARKLFPGFFHLYREGLMPVDFRIIGTPQGPMTTSASTSAVHLMSTATWSATSTGTTSPSG